MAGQVEFVSARVPTVRIAGSRSEFAVGRIFCVGRNYQAHANEMGITGREAPFFFTKFPDSVVAWGRRLRYPPATRDFHYEGELVVAIRREGYAVPQLRPKG